MKSTCQGGALYPPEHSHNLLGGGEDGIPMGIFDINHTISADDTNFQAID